MNQKTPRPLVSMLVPLLAFVMVFLLVTGASAVFTFLLPKTYCSVARVRVERDDPRRPGRPPARVDPSFISTECLVFQSELVLTQVVAQLNLNEEWGKHVTPNHPLKTDESLKILKSDLVVRPVPNTVLIEIRACSERPDEAATLANAVVEAYRSFRQGQARALVMGDLRKLQEATQHWNDVEEQVKTVQSEITRLRIELQVPTPDPVGIETNATFGPYVDAKKRMTELLSSRSNLEQQVKSMKSSAVTADTRSVEVVDSALPNSDPVRPRVGLNLFLGALLGIVLGAVAAAATGGFVWLRGRSGPRLAPARR